MLKFIVKLTYMQMMEVGIHIGHSLRKSKFLSFWMFFGYRNNMFVFNLLKSKFILKLALSQFYNVGIEGDHIFFVNLNKHYNIMVYKYAMLIHAGVALEKWVNGCLSNFEHVLVYFNHLVDLFEEKKYRLKYHQKKRLVELYGFIKEQENPPAAMFITKAEKAFNAIDESYFAWVPCATIVDSNMPSWTIAFPIPGNDDSIICLNYYYYLMTKSAFMGQVFNVNTYKTVKPDDVRLFNKILSVYIFLRKQGTKIKDVYKYSDIKFLNHIKDLKKDFNIRWGVDARNYFLSFVKNKDYAYIPDTKVKKLKLFYTESYLRQEQGKRIFLKNTMYDQYQLKTKNDDTYTLS